MNYLEKLRDPRWQKKRLKILERDNFKCCHCGDGLNELHVHHYKYHGNPWEVEDEYLVTLCKYCHSTIESIKKDLGEIFLPKNNDRNIAIKEIYKKNIFLVSYTHLKEILNVSNANNDIAYVFFSKNHLESLNRKIKINE